MRPAHPCEKFALASMNAIMGRDIAGACGQLALVRPPLEPRAEAGPAPGPADVEDFVAWRRKQPKGAKVAVHARAVALAAAAADSFSTEDMAHTPDKDEDDGLGFSNSLGGAGSHGGSGRWSSAQSSAASNNGGASVDSCSNMVSSEPKPSSCPSEARLPKLSSRSEGSNPSARLSKTSTTSSNSCLTKPTAESPYKTSEFYIIRVSIEASGPETEGVIMYKSIMIGNHERTREVIRNAMMKHGLEGSPDSYSLSQVLPDKELLIPPTANVYYAVSTQHDLNFVLREKHEDINDCLGQDTSVVDPLHTSTPKSGPRKGSRDTSKARRKLLGLQL